MVIANLIDQAGAPSTWISARTQWKKWLTFCNVESIDPLSGDSAYLIRFLGWLHTEGAISSRSVTNYISAVVTAHTRVGIFIPYTPLLKLPMAAFKKSDFSRKRFQDPTSLHEHCGLPSDVSRAILDAALAAPDSNITFRRNATAVLTSDRFFERGEAGSSLLMIILLYLLTPPTWPSSSGRPKRLLPTHCTTSAALLLFFLLWCPWWTCLSTIIAIGAIPPRRASITGLFWDNGFNHPLVVCPNGGSHVCTISEFIRRRKFLAPRTFYELLQLRNVPQ